MELFSEGCAFLLSGVPETCIRQSMLTPGVLKSRGRFPKERPRVGRMMQGIHLIV